MDKTFSRKEAAAFIQGLELTKNYIPVLAYKHAQDLQKVIDGFRNYYKIWKKCPTCGKEISHG